MYTDIEVPDIVDLYITDLHQIQHLTNSQEIWLGIAIDSVRLINDSTNLRRPTGKENLEYIYVSLFNKIRTLFDQLQSFEEYFQNNSFSLMEGIKILVYEAVEFKNTTAPVKQSIIDTLLDGLPERANNVLFDLASSLWLLPLSLIDYYHKELSKNNSFPRISEVLNVYNPLEGLEELKNIADHALNARKMLISSYLSYVKWFAYKYRNFGLDYEDVIQEGSIGLIKAVDKFDVRRKIRLKTFAVWWIRQSITRALADNSRVIRLPVHLSDAFQSLKKEHRMYINTHTEEPSVGVLAESSGLDVKRVIELIRWVRPPLPLEKMKFCEENLIKHTESKNNYRILPCQECERITRAQRDQVEALIVDLEIPICLDQSLITLSYEKSDYSNLLYKIFPDSFSEDQVDRIFREKIGRIITGALDQLTPRERRIIDYRYGFKDGESNTLQEVGDKFDVTRERIRQIESAALEKLRKILEKNPTIREYNRFD